MKLTKKKIYTLFMCVLMAVFTFFLSFQTPTFKTYASEDEVIDFDSTNVIDDLLSADSNFVANFPPNENANPKIQVIQVVEYCYSYRENMRDNYGLYIYVYNPTNLNIVRHSKSNQIMIAVSYDSDPITSSSLATDYEYFELEFCSASVGEFSNLYYKFKVVDKVGKDGKTIAQRVNSAERRYDIAGIELLTSGSYNADDYAVGQVYTFTGYAKGYGFDSDVTESTLECYSRSFETISFDVKHTFYRTNESDKGVGHQNQIDTVYFRVPERFFQVYGTLQRIKAEWYEFVTKDIVVTNNEEFYNSAVSFVGTNSFPSNYVLASEFVDSDYNWPIYPDAPEIVFRPNYGSWVFGGVEGSASTVLYENTIDGLFYLFATDDWCDIDSYDPLSDAVDIGGIKGSELLKHILEYNISYNNGALPIKQGNVSKDLFDSDIEESRKMNDEFGVVQYGGIGKSVYDFDADIDFEYIYSGNFNNFWDNCDNYGFWDTIFKNFPYVEESFSPIQVLTAVDLEGTDEELSERLLVNYNDVASIRNEYATAVANGERLVLFRFALSDYYSEKIEILKVENSFNKKLIRDSAYRAKESVFLDFNIIQLTFRKDNKFYVIPVVSNPTDLVADITPPISFDDSTSLLQIILAVLLLILLIIILLALLPHLLSLIIWLLKGILKVVIWLISLPFKIFKKRE